MPIENSLVYGEHGERYTKCARTGYTILPCLLLQCYLADLPYKGYEIGEEEVKISLESFRRDYADPSGAPESVPIPRYHPIP